MPTAAVLFSRLRQTRPSSSLSLLYVPRVLSSRRPSPLPASALPSSPTLAFFDAFHSRAFSTRSSDERELGLNSFGVDSQVNSELLKAIADTSGSGEEDAVFPVRVLISMFDSFHELSGFPWWLTIVSSTLALRIAILFPLVLTLHKLKRIGEFFPKLPPPFPPPFSGKSYIRQFLLFQKKRKASGCPSYVWPLVPFIVQGGALWFRNLTELSHGYSGFIFPFLIAGLHYINVQISFGKPVVAEARNIFELLAKYYKRYLDFLTLPLAFVGFCIPQGSQLYWVTNSSFTLIQQITLRHPAVVAMLGLQDKNSQKVAIEKIGASKTAPSPGIQDNIPIEAFSAEKSSLNSPEKWHRIPIEEMSPKELTALAVPFLSSNDKESAIPLLKLALDKDPEYVRALVLMGRILLLKHANEEAIEYFECAISKLSFAGYPTDAEELDLLILSSQWAGVACERQGKRNEGRTHFERIANMEEPEDPTSKGYYFDGLLLLASTLFDAGQKAEAAKYLRLVVVHKPAYKKFLDQCEQDDDIASDLASRRDY
ncbi:ALBINO3-like protein 2, chloroplastic isoform X2 [Vigna radiata var. radiata]|uniref:ALBINO3-like protein 2, chloroplastic isoform X2 n=1 Tax=Vigna radiata var. radiata TaxID=3916 RepID=A0A3Q0EWX6_VIGRR|nr:ALBINO3-like protein 2, chloroplastic isoform X2 [Vigna radiata var. radiata]